MITLSEDPPERNIPRSVGAETSDSGPGGRSGLLSGRAAAILGSSFVVAVIAGVLTYLALGRSTEGLAGGVLAAGAAFAGTVRLLLVIIT